METPVAPRFTGKERDAESGLDYFMARYLAPSMGRFMTPDWSEAPEDVPYAKLDDPQTLNLYAAGGPELGQFQLWGKQEPVRSVLRRGWPIVDEVKCGVSRKHSLLACSERTVLTRSSAGLRRQGRMSPRVGKPPTLGHPPNKRSRWIDAIFVHNCAQGSAEEKRAQAEGRGQMMRAHWQMIIIAVTAVSMFTVHAVALPLEYACRDSVDGAHYAVCDKKIYVVEGRSVHVLEAQTGLEIKNYSIKDDAPNGIVVTADRTVMSIGGSYTNVVSYFRGNLAWKIDHRSTRLEHDHGIIFLNNQIDDSLVALSSLTGRKMWISRSIEGTRRPFAYILPVNGRYLISSFAILSATTGKVIKRLDSEAVGGGENQYGVWVLNTDGVLLEYD